MINRKSTKVAGTLSVETTTELLVGTAAEPKHVTALLFTEYTAGGEQHDALIRIYLDTVKMCEFPLIHFLAAFDSDTKIAVGKVDLNIDLPAGAVLEVGHVSGGTASDIFYTAEYTIGR